MTFSLDSRSNLMGTKFTVYDHGVSPTKAQGLVEKTYTRQELAAVCYVSAVLLSRWHFTLSITKLPSHTRFCMFKGNYL